MIPRHEASGERVEGLILECPDGTTRRFFGDDKSNVLSEARRFLKKRSYNAEITDNI